MKALRWEVRPYRAAFVRPIGTARGMWAEREGYWVCCRDEDGVYGLGEVAPLPDWGTESFALAGVTLARLDAGLPDTKRTPASHAGAELAMFDYRARRARVNLATYLAAHFKREALSRIPVNALLTAESPEGLLDETQTAVERGYMAIKLKVGRQPLQRDVERIRLVREVVGEDAELRLDGNGGWTREEAIRVLRAFAPWNPAYVEQPVAADDVEGLVRVEQASGVRVAADEAVRDLATAERLIAAGVSVLVLKPMALGGLRAAGAIAETARRHGTQVVLTSVLDRGLGTWGVLHLAAALGLETAAGLDTDGLWAEGAAIGGLSPVNGYLAVPAGLDVVADDLEEVRDGAVPLR